MIQAPAEHFLSCANCWITLVVLPNLTQGIGDFAPLRGDANTCATIELNHLEPAFFPHPPCQDPDPRGDADFYGTHMSCTSIMSL